jgi:hypothetical protein
MVAVIGFQQSRIEAQQVWGPWVSVAMSQCQCMGCSTSTGTFPNCELLSIACHRRDSSLSVSSGNQTEVRSEPVTCEYCPTCCTDPPCSCHDLPSSVYCDDAKLTCTDELSDLVLAACLGPAAPGVEQGLFGAIGYTGNATDMICPAFAGLCTITTTTASLWTWVGAKATQDHEWRVVRIFTGEECQVTAPVITSCGGATSGVVADVVDPFSGTCTVRAEPCGPVCP